MANAVCKVTDNINDYTIRFPFAVCIFLFSESYYEGWNFNSGNYLFTTDTK